MKLNQLRTANIERDIEWCNGEEPLSICFRATELAGEVGEACNIIKKIERERLGLVGTRASMEELADELADVIICTDLIAMDLGVDLGEAIRNKFNKTSEKYNLKTKI